MSFGDVNTDPASILKVYPDATDTTKAHVVWTNTVDVYGSKKDYKINGVNPTAFVSGLGTTEIVLKFAAVVSVGDIWAYNAGGGIFARFTPNSNPLPFSDFVVAGPVHVTILSVTGGLDPADPDGTGDGAYLDIVFDTTFSEDWTTTGVGLNFVYDDTKGYPEATGTGSGTAGASTGRIYISGGLSSGNTWKLNSTNLPLDTRPKFTGGGLLTENQTGVIL